MYFLKNIFCIYSGYLSLILPFFDMKYVSVKNMQKLELENGAQSLLMGCLFLLATFFFFGTSHQKCSKRHQLELADVKSGRHIYLPKLANLSIKAAKILNININKLERVEFFSRVQKGKNSYSNQSNCQQIQPQGTSGVLQVICTSPKLLGLFSFFFFFLFTALYELTASLASMHAFLFKQYKHTVHISTLLSSTHQLKALHTFHSGVESLKCLSTCATHNHVQLIHTERLF